MSKQLKCLESIPLVDENPKNKENSIGFKQWTTEDGTSFFPAGTTHITLEPGFYEIKIFDQRIGFSKLNCTDEELINFPETNSSKVIEEISKFWNKQSIYNSYGLTYKRGILLYGPPGSGKTSTVHLVLNDVIRRGGVAFKFYDPRCFNEAIRTFRLIQPTTPVVVLMEDIDSIIADWGETDVLNILDGVEKIEKVVYLATTNYPEQLGERFINRPSRFDRRFKMPHPGAESRKLYLQYLVSKDKSTTNLVDIPQWVKDTEGMSISHLRELFIAVCILDNEYKETVNFLRNMVEEKVSSADDIQNNNIGFRR